jgi:Zn-dependent M28 family amino/carboxypeptidase
MSRRFRLRCVAALIAVGIIAGCSGEPVAPPPAPPPPAPRLTEALAEKMTSEAISAHLKELQRIADANGRTRAAGTSGAAATIDYVAKALRDKGFDVQTPEFDRLDTVSPGDPKLTVAGRNFPVVQASVLVMTQPAGLTGPVVRPAVSAGCAAADYRNPLPKGAIAVVDDAACSAVDKQNAAISKGAAAVLIVSGGKNGAPRGLFGHGYYNGLTAPVAVITPDVDAALRKSTAPVQLRLDGKTTKVTSRNVIAQTKSGDQHNVVMVGAHLDSAANSPGINSNGTGVAAVLQIALEMGPSPAVANAVRFAFWGGDQATVQGAMHYVFGLERDPLNDIALYLDVDTIGSRNAGFFTYDGDQSGTPGKDFTPDDIPIGSAGIDRMLSGYLNLAGKRPADIQLTTAMDISSFLAAGVPVGGVTTGGAQQKTQAQVRLWGGTAGQPFDPNYRTAKDLIENVDPAALAAMSAAVAETVAAYAESTDGVNGVPARNQRHRAPVRP